MAKLIGLASTKGDNVDSLCPSRILPNAFFLRERYETSFARPRAAASALSYTGGEVARAHDGNASIV
jgi:hypothetical protein